MQTAQQIPNQPQFGVLTPVQTRIEDYDMFGHVNNVRCVSYLEIARSHVFFDVLGLSRAETNALTANININYLKPIKYGLPVGVSLSVKKMGTKSMDLSFQIVDHDNPETVFAEGEIAQVLIDMKTTQTCAIPEPLREKVDQLNAGNPHRAGVDRQYIIEPKWKTLS